MKKTCFIISILILTFILCACSPKTDTNDLTLNNYNTTTENETSDDTKNKETLHEMHTDATGSIVYDKDNINIIAKQISFTNDHDPIFVFVIDTDQKISPIIGNVSINNMPVDEYSYSYYNNGEFYVGSIIFDADTLKSNDITQISSFEFSFELASPDTGNIIAETGSLSLTVGPEGSLERDIIK